MRLVQRCALAGVLGVVLAVSTPSPVDGSVDGSEPLEDLVTLGINRLGGLAIDRFDNVYVADVDGDRVLRITPDGEVSTVAGGNGKGSASDQLDGPSTVAIDRRGNLFVSDKENHRVQRIAPDGSATTVIGGPVGDPVAGVALWRPRGVAVDHVGNVYVTDEVERVLRVSPDGEVDVVAGDNGRGPGPDQLDSPQSLAVDLWGNLYIDDNHNHRIQKVAASDGTVTTISTKGLVYDPRSIAVDGDGAIYMSNFLPFHVAKFEVDGTTSIVAEGEETFAGVTLWPLGLAFDSRGSLYVVDRVPGSIRVMRNTTPPGPREITGPFARTAGIDGSVARLYMAILGRQPDLAGYDYWVEQAANGARLAEIAHHFLVASEYQRTRSGFSNSEFVDRLYLDVMGRSGDAIGAAYWTGVLDSGVDRATVLLLFSESAEFKRHTGTN